ncbi:hypothetical protein CEUSTIGMA_g169.t1 [Chlamydomonas eustigma]|uniref:Proteasome assembly chaperone 2 n=1 Tax=Chlamydomonas eustigma TaxID=1157962 RepID=A0A250WPG6_9CHLO|nr:hypothetical protein CEUSTIGMA_g169.t1 [Chlamydomonas eustigma]|eukprot:GAX72713.1 hypothetical protein CEUSTIGMA_g169.t1 [Chlamydomonas eustigma]
MDIFPVKGSSLEDLKLKDSVIILPAVATGNVGELAVEILLASLPVRLAAYIENENVLPCVGNDPVSISNPGALSTVLELFEVMPGTSSKPESDVKVYLLQQRAPAMQGRQAAYAQSIVAWAQSHRVGRLVVLSGLDASLCKDKQLLGPTARYYSISDTKEAAAAQSLGIEALEAEYLQEERELHGLLPPWPLLAAAASHTLPALMLACFASEGDNIPQAMQLATYTRDLMPTLVGTALTASAAAVLRIPCSFASLFGRSSGFESFLG